MKRYKADQYWQERLAKDFSLGGVGYLGLGVEYNKWLYKARTRALSKLLQRRQINPHGQRILDIGVGTGFYIDYWKGRGAEFITGLDITDKSISSLKARYPEYRFVKADISCQQLLIDGEFDIITAFDVLFHIVDEDRFEQAIRNIKRLSHEKTKILITDSFLRNYCPAAFHENDRTLGSYQEVMKNNGISMLELIPIFYFTNRPADSAAIRNKFIRVLLPHAWVALMWILRFNNRLGLLGRRMNSLLGHCLYLVDGIVLKYTKDGPSSKLLLAQLE
ncbi:class I SAM-dependent methyltransferase [Chloroflexota bacterium]